MVTNPDVKNISRDELKERQKKPREVQGHAMLTQLEVNGRTCWCPDLPGQEA